MATSTEELLKQLKRSERSEQIMVPLIEMFMKDPVEVDDKADRVYLNNLIKARMAPRKKGIYSPSMLSSCVRQVYLHKIGTKGTRLPRISSNGIFLDGNFRHFKWQFVIWKMHRAGIVQLIDVGTICLGTEIWVENEKGDSGGTIDQLVFIPSHDLLCTLDYKGMNSNSFLSSVANGPSRRYIVQSVDYGGLGNYYLKDYLPKKIESAIIIGENKNGAINTRAAKSPLGLSEWVYDLEDYRVLVSKRKKLLRSYERRREIPPPECVSTSRLQFKDCPFNKICRAEVEAIERKRRKLNVDEKPKVRFTKNRGSESKTKKKKG